MQRDSVAADLAAPIRPWAVGLAPAAVMLLRASLAPLCAAPMVVTAQSSVTELGLMLPDLLILDLDDAAGDPLESLRMIRFVLPACFIVVYSCKPEPSWTRSCHLAGANCLLAKASNVDEVRFGFERMLADGSFTDPKLTTR